jgi:FkbM family methyltransferase
MRVTSRVRQHTVVYDEKRDVYVREESFDARSAGEVRSLIRQLGITQDDVVLDVGGHIGAYARICCKIGARVVTIEPEATNLAVLERNVAEFGDKCVIIAAAATDDHTLLTAGDAALYLHGRTHTGLNSLHGKSTTGTSTVQVPVVSFRDTLLTIRPTALKVDIEGGEWLLNWDDIPNHVTKINIEMHMIPESGGGRIHAPVVHQKLINQGFTVTRQPNFSTMWGTQAMYVRTDSHATA